LDPNRATQAEIGDYVVFFHDFAFERGQMISETQVRNIKMAGRIVPLPLVGGLKIISKHEHNDVGLVDCPNYLTYDYFTNECHWLVHSTYSRVVNTTETKDTCELPISLRPSIRYLQTYNVSLYTGAVGEYFNNVTNLTQKFFNYGVLFDVTPGWTLGGLHPFGFWQLQPQEERRTVSSSFNTVNNTRESILTYWEADITDRNVFIEIESITTKPISTVLIHVRKSSVTLNNATTLINIPVYFQVFVNEWQNHTELTSNETEYVIDVSNQQTWKTRVFAHHTFSIYEFVAYSNQECTSRDIFMYSYTRNVVNDTAYKVQENVTNSATCISIQFPVPEANGTCEDEMHIRFLDNVTQKTNFTVLLTEYTLEQLFESTFGLTNSTVYIVFVNDSLLVLTDGSNNTLYQPLIANETVLVNNATVQFFGTVERYFILVGKLIASLRVKR
jgi:hypothetical protein